MIEGGGKLAERYRDIQQCIHNVALQVGRSPEEIKLIVVSKNHPATSIQTLFELGCRDFGESRIQELVEKAGCLSSDIQWHLVGSLQRNKVKQAIQTGNLIHSIDSLELAKEIEKKSQILNRITPILLQVNVSGERSKRGMAPDQWERVLIELNSLPCIVVRGLMTIAPLTDDQKLIRDCFSNLRLLRDKWKNIMKNGDVFHDLSMGMSHDYKIAIEEGATLLRIGSAILL